MKIDELFNLLSCLIPDFVFYQRVFIAIITIRWKGCKRTAGELPSREKGSADERRGAMLSKTTTRPAALLRYPTSFPQQLSAESVFLAPQKMSQVDNQILLSLWCPSKNKKSG